MVSFVLWSTLLTACPPIPVEDTSPPADSAVDGDNDGSLDFVDCDDADPDVHPGADEACNELDDDCDGEVDEDPVGAPVWWADADGDTFGDPLAPAESCQQPEGRVGNDLDCNDRDASVNPAATEVCDAADLDEDCDGVADDADDSRDPATTSPAFLDDDGDGAGDDEEEIGRCDLPVGYVAVGGDCDDGDPDRAAYCYVDGYGSFTTNGGCEYHLELDSGGADACPDCDFTFAALATLTAGSCYSAFDAKIGFLAADPALYFRVYTSGATGVEIGPFPGEIHSEIGFDILDFGGYGPVYGGYYAGYLAMYSD